MNNDKMKEELFVQSSKAIRTLTSWRIFRDNLKFNDVLIGTEDGDIVFKDGKTKNLLFKI